MIDGCELRSAYHGWTYDAEGRVTRVPAREELSPAFRNVRVNVKNNPESGAGDTYRVMKRYQVFLPNAMKLNSADLGTLEYRKWLLDIANGTVKLAAG